MDIDTKYAVKLFFANSTFLQVFFEAVANSLDAEATAIEILVSSQQRLALGRQIHDLSNHPE